MCLTDQNYDNYKNFYDDNGILGLHRNYNTADNHFDEKPVGKL